MGDGGDDWAEGMNEFDNAIWTAKEAGITKQELIDEINEQYDQG